MRRVKLQLQRTNLSEEISDIIRKMIFDGRLAPGNRINEVQLSTKLGVSRTPLRESLASLAGEGALDIVPRKGFFVRELTAAEARSIYPIRAILDPEALFLAGIPTPGDLKEASNINKSLRIATTVDKAIALDDLWHMTLYRGCPNAELLSLIKVYMRKTKRYELASMREQSSLNSSYKSKLRIVTLLKSDDLEGACKRLKKSLTTGLDPVLAWLQKRGKAE